MLLTEQMWQELSFFVMRTVIVHLLLTDKLFYPKFICPKYSKWFLFLFNFIGAGADNDLYINQAIVFIEDAIQVSINFFLAVMLPMLDVCHTLPDFKFFYVQATFVNHHLDSQSKIRISKSCGMQVSLNFCLGEIYFSPQWSNLFKGFRRDAGLRSEFHGGFLFVYLFGLVWLGMFWQWLTYCQEKLFEQTLWFASQSDYLHILRAGKSSRVWGWIQVWSWNPSASAELGAFGSLDALFVSPLLAVPAGSLDPVTSQLVDAGSGNAEGQFLSSLAASRWLLVGRFLGVRCI